MKIESYNLNRNANTATITVQHQNNQHNEIHFWRFENSFF